MSQDNGAVKNDDGASSAHEKPRTHKVGRPTGSRNRDKVNLQKRIQDKGRIIFSRLMHWINHEDGQVSIAAIRLAMAYGWGKPPDRLLIGNDHGKPFVVATPDSVTTFEEWERLTVEQEQRTIDAVGQHVGSS